MSSGSVLSGFLYKVMNRKRGLVFLAGFAEDGGPSLDGDEMRTGSQKKGKVVSRSTEDDAIIGNPSFILQELAMNSSLWSVRSLAALPVKTFPSNVVCVVVSRQHYRYCISRRQRTKK